MDIIKELDTLKKTVKALEAYIVANQEEYIPADAYAQKRDLAMNTVNAYCRNGVFTDCHKKGGRWYIHRRHL